MEPLTKENFWDEMTAKYPKAMNHFCAWVDEYKKENDWDDLFNGNINEHKGHNGGWETELTVAPKYYELPTNIQFGIFLGFIFDTTKVQFKLIIGPPGTTIDYWLSLLEHKL